MGGGRPIAECRCVPAPFVAGQPDTLMQGFVTKQTKNRNWRQRYAILTPRLSHSLFTHHSPQHALTRDWEWGMLTCTEALYFYTGRTGDHTKGVVPLSSQTDLFDMAKGPGLMSGFFFSIEFVATETN